MAVTKTNGIDKKLKKFTINVRCKFCAPYGIRLTLSQVNERLTTYFDKRGHISTYKDGSKYIITSYKFENVNAEIKLKIHYDKLGFLNAIDTLGTFDVYKKYMVESINFYKIILKGFLKYLENSWPNWFVDVFVFRIFPIPFERHFLSRIGDIDNVNLTVRMSNGDYCIIKEDRLEYRTSEWDVNQISIIERFITQYTRK